MGNVKAIQSFAFITLFASAFAGCASNNSADTQPGIDQTIPGATKWGHYDGEPVTKWNPDGRTMTLLTELRYTDPHGEVWVAPIGSVVDGASIPRYLWSVMGGPFEGRYRNASVLHDVRCTASTSAPGRIVTGCFIMPCVAAALARPNPRRCITLSTNSGTIGSFPLSAANR